MTTNRYTLSGRMPCGWRFRLAFPARVLRANAALYWCGMDAVLQHRGARRYAAQKLVE
jgi:hypothetical protein